MSKKVGILIKFNLKLMRFYESKYIIKCFLFTYLCIQYNAILEIYDNRKSKGIQKLERERERERERE